MGWIVSSVTRASSWYNYVKQSNTRAGKVKTIVCL